MVRSLGGDQFAEISLAGRTGLYDLHPATWWPDALDLLGVDETLFPGDPVLGIEGAGRASFAPIAGATLAVAGHDHQVAAFVSGATDPGCLFESLGTADALTVTVSAPVAVADVLAVVDFGATIGRTVVPDRLIVMIGLRTGQILDRIGRLLGVEDRTARRRLSERAAGREPTRSWRSTSPTGWCRSPGSATAPMRPTCGGRPSPRPTSARSTWSMPTPDGSVRHGGVVVGGWLAHDPTIDAAVHRRFPSAVRTRFGEPGAVGAACVAGISVGVLDGDGRRCPPRRSRHDRATACPCSKVAASSAPTAR